MGGSQSYEIVPQQDRVVVITGANTGLGFETAKAIAGEGAHVIMACRNKEKCDVALKEVVDFVKEEKGIDANVESMIVDLGSQESIRTFCQEYREKGLPLNTLINNAGIMALPNRELTVDGIEKQWGVNHFGPFTLTMLLLDIIEKSDKPRIVNLASSAHKMARKEDFNRDNLLLDEGYGDWSAYGRSKISNIFFTQQLDEYLKSRNSPITVNAIHPGVVATELGRNMDAPEWQKNLVAVFLKKPEDGAKTQVKAALAEEYAEVSGKYMYDEAVQKTNDLAQDKELQQFVWDISLELTGLKEVEDGVWQYVEQQKEQEQEENVEIVSEVEE